ncbi:MAG TPA: glycosyltransferase family 4 protein [Acidimicrobiales bacterium]|nr:glycosyltransferase family 4 protein [Acidimicrobiales bacterium]
MTSVLLLGLGSQRDQPSGLNRYVDDLHRAMTGAGTEITTVIEAPATDPPPGVVVAGRNGAPLPLRLAAYGRAASRAARHADVVDAHFALYASPTLLLPSLRHLPLVVHFHGPWAEESASGGQLGRSVLVAKTVIERAVYRRASRLVTLSAAFADLAVERYGIDRARIEVIPPAVDLSRFTPGDRAAARKRLGVADETWLAVSARRLVPRMGLEVLVQAWPEVGAQSRLVIIGSGPLDRQLRLLADESGVGARVHLAGRVPDDELVDWYRAADVAVLPSVSLEGFGLAAIEALACGTPVVVTDVGGLPEAVAGLPGAPVVRAGDVQALAARLVDARLGTRTLATREQCRAFAERFSPEALAASHQSLFASVARQRAGPLA